MARGQKPLTDSEWRERVREIGGGEYEPLTPYVRNDEKVLLRHIPCGMEWSVAPNNFRKGNRCPKCLYNKMRGPGRRLALTLYDVRQRMTDKWGDEYTVLAEDYINYVTPVLVRHNTCGHEWKVRLSNLLRILGPSTCPRCARGWTHEEFLKRVAEAFEGDQYEVLEAYAGSNTPIFLRHRECGHEWRCSPNNFLNNGSLGTRCPACTDAQNSKLARLVHSKLVRGAAERALGPVLREQRVPGGPRSCVLDRLLSFDFVLPEVPAFVEVDGELHDIPWNDEFGRERLEMTQANDAARDAWCTGRGHPLLRVRHDDPDPAGTVAGFLAGLVRPTQP
jgi:very-short-patch-repair endonuclease/predicted Zn-ribbon and HTH transcriptional regulator